jgi:Reverse transcriptase (RNA-dependent DNA polymerase)
VSKITVPVEALICSNLDCVDHASTLESYYDDIVNCMRIAGRAYVLRIKVGLQKHCWSPELDELKQQYIDARDIWKSAGRPHSGDINSNQVRCKMRYKTAIEDACTNADSEFNDNLYNSLRKKDVDGFRKSWRKKFCQNNLKPTCTQNGKTGDDNIRTEFTEYSKSVLSLNSVGADDCFKSEVDELQNDARNNGDNALSSPIDIAMIQQCVNSLKPRKAAGPDELCNEYIILRGVQLFVHLCLLFNAMLKHSFVPSAFHCGVIIPLLKNKHGHASRLDMYSGITLSVVVSKLFELALLSIHGDSLSSDNLQFRFKKDSSCSHALYTLGETVEYFTKHGSKIQCISLDTTKAFDKVLHHGLLLKMLCKGIPVTFVCILRKWYSNLTCSVSWNCILSESLQ